MSALGQKQTYAVQKAMSALPPIATSIAYFGMSALGQKRTFVTDAICQLFDHLIGGVEQAQWNGKPKRFGCLEIDDKFEFGQPFDRQVARLGAPKDTTNIESSMSISFHQIIAISHQSASGDDIAVGRCHRITGRETDYLFATAQ